MTKAGISSVLADGTVYSKRKNFCPFSTSPPEAYVPILGEERMERLQKIAQRVKGLKMLTLNASAQGGGVAEMLYSAVPFLNMLGVEGYSWFQGVFRVHEGATQLTTGQGRLLQSRASTDLPVYPRGVCQAESY